MSAPDCFVIWIVPSGGSDVRCQMLTCCTGAELQIVRDDEVLLRELYPDKSDLYERARQLRKEYERTGFK
jgi:hypothetical protein